MTNRLYSVLIFHNAVEKEGDMKRLPVKNVVFKLAVIGIQTTKHLRKTTQCLNFEDMLSTETIKCHPNLHSYFQFSRLFSRLFLRLLRFTSLRAGLLYAKMAATR